MKKIVIVDYGLGNIRSVEQSLKRALEEKEQSGKVFIINNYKDVNFATHIILPGQGAFASCIKGLKNMPGMIETLSENVLVHKKPFLGICVGMQLLADKSYENGMYSGHVYRARNLVISKVGIQNSPLIPTIVLIQS